MATECLIELLAQDPPWGSGAIHTALDALLGSLNVFLYRPELNYISVTDYFNIVEGIIAPNDLVQWFNIEVSMRLS